MPHTDTTPTFSPTLKPRLVYVYGINDEKHQGYLKVGQTTLPDYLPHGDYAPGSEELNELARHRIDAQTQTAAVAYTLLHTELTRYPGSDRYFTDHEVHRVLLRSGYDRMPDGREWFHCSLDAVKAAIEAVKEGRDCIDPKTRIEINEQIEFRPEQEEAIRKTVKHFEGKTKSRQFLWDAKMRFGKTLSALEVVRRLGYKRTLILTHRPVVRDGWYDDFKKIFDGESGYHFGSKEKGENLDALEQHKAPYIYFASIQDLRGSEMVGGDFDKNAKLFAISWDLIIVDEAHEGTLTELGQRVIEKLLEKKETKALYLSGTPFNLLPGFSERETYRWDYIMEQRAKATWREQHPDDPNPYEGLPALSIYTYDLGALLGSGAVGGAAFNFREFFRVDDTGDTFVHGDDIDRFLNLLCGIGSPGSLYPFATEKFRDAFRHTLWVLPGVAAARLLAKRLREHEIFKQFTVVNVAGPGDEEIAADNALKEVQDAIKENDYTITLSCGRLTTGVTVREWTAVLMLYGSWKTSPASYMQTIFRVQSPYSDGGRVKECCYAFDFAPDRTLSVVVETAGCSGRIGEQSETDRKQLGDFLNYCPVIAMDGSTMQPYDVNGMMAQLNRIRIEGIVRRGFEDANLYDSTALNQLNEEDWGKFVDLDRIIGKTGMGNRVSDVVVNAQGLTDQEQEEAKQLERTKKSDRTPEEQARLNELQERIKAQQKARETAISILRGISIRMPLILFGAEIEDEEQKLTIDNFTELVDDTSWAEFMPMGVTKELFGDFKRYYDPIAFQAAGRRIRELTRLADGYTIEERIVSLGELFGTFRNPDKETVLTPWRAVNLHLGEALGGYSFYDDSYEEPLSDPHPVVVEGVTGEVFAPSARILEINSKSGLYPLYAAYSIYRRRLAEDSGTDKQTIWDQTLRDNIFVLCKTPMAVSITRRTLVGFRDVSGLHIVYYPDLIEEIQSNSSKVIDALCTSSLWSITDTISSNDMKFDTIIGNPPYQIATDNTRTKPVYNLFMDLSMALADRVSLITPARYLFDAGFTPKGWNEKMLGNPHLKVIRYEPDSSKIFPNVDIKGGVAVIYYDKSVDFGAIGRFIPFEELRTIAEKVKNKQEESLIGIVYSNASYHFDTDNEDVKSFVSERRGGDDKIPSNIFESLPDLFTETQSEGQIGFWGRLNNQRCMRYIDRNYIAYHPNLNKWKVFVPKSNGSGALGEVLSTPLIGEPLIGATQTFISIGAFETRGEAEACMKYVKSRFARTLLGILKVTQHNPRDTWELIPLQDFTPSSDIDWSGSVGEIDRQLYRKYGLTEQEIAFIEEKVCPME